MDKLVKRYKIGEAFNYTLEVDVMPEVPVDKSKYEGLNVTVEKEMFDQEAYDNALMTLRKRHMITTDLDEETPAELGHQLMVNMRGFYKDLNGDKGSPLPAIAKGDAIELKMIEGEFIPGMVESLVGIKEGETRDIDIKFPKRSNEQTNQLADQEAIFEVECLVVQSLELPEVNEEFANSIREGMSLKEVDDRLREGVMQQVEDKMEGRERYMLTEALVDTLPDDFEVPESLVQEVVKEQFAEMLSMEREKGKTDAQLKELVSQENYENFGKLMKPKSIRRVKGSLALQALLKNEGLTVSISEIDDELVNQKMQAQQKKEKFSESEMRPRVQETLEKYKALDYLKEKGTITYVDAEGELTEEEIMGETAEELAERLKKEGLAKKEKA
jgi:trigger factor